MRRRAFTAAELLTVLLLLSVVVCLLLPGARKQRVAAQLSSSLANLHHIAALSASYNADNQDYAPYFSWTRGVEPNTQFADLRSRTLGAIEGLTPWASQAVDIIRRRTGQPSFPMQEGWAPHAYYTHLVLADYAAIELPSFNFISPADPVRLTTARRQTPGDRWAFSSSYEFQVHFGQLDRRFGTGAYGGVTCIGYHNSFQATTDYGNYLGPRRMSEVRYPSQKVHVFDSNDRHFASRPRWHAEPDAIPLVLAADGHTRTRAASTYNMGADPALQSRIFPLSYTYRPASVWDPPLAGGASSITCTGYLRWPRGGLQGRDFDGAEVDTSGW
ncbi:MAG: hypothetical protein ACOYN0_08240 [Phycisphaerales bacterium]